MCCCQIIGQLFLLEWWVLWHVIYYKVAYSNYVGNCGLFACTSVAGTCVRSKWPSLWAQTPSLCHSSWSCFASLCLSHLSHTQLHLVSNQSLHYLFPAVFTSLCQCMVLCTPSSPDLHSLLMVSLHCVIKLVWVQFLFHPPSLFTSAYPWSPYSKRVSVFMSTSRSAFTSALCAGGHEGSVCAD